MKPHIAIDVRMARDSGIGTYVRHVLPPIVAARPEWRFTLLGRSADLAALGWDSWPNVVVTDCSSRIYSIAEQAELPRKTPRDVDLFWSPHYNIPVFHGGPLVVTVHDVFHLAMPQFVPGRLERLYARAMFAAVQRRARAILTVSEFSRAEYRRLVGRGGPEPHVIHNGVDAAWLEGDAPEASTRLREDVPYVLFVGNVKPHKNLRTLLRAFASIADVVPHDLVIVGRRDGLRVRDVDAEREATALGTRVRFLGEVEDATLRRCVAGAAALVAPSMYEGFGLPPLEAMASGCPTLVARAAAFPEVCSDAAMYCDPADPADMARALQRLLTDEALRADLRARGRRHARQFTWARTAAETLRVLERTLEAT